MYIFAVGGKLQDSKFYGIENVVVLGDKSLVVLGNMHNVPGFVNLSILSPSFLQADVSEGKISCTSFRLNSFCSMFLSEVFK